MKDVNIRNKQLWFGISKHPFFWFDCGSFFSVDVGKWFLRIFFEIRELNFCRYLGMISKSL